MELLEIAKALRSELRLMILLALAEQTEPITLIEIQKAVSIRGASTRHRETVYRAVEVLVALDLVEKIYVKNKGICYRLIKPQIILDFKKGECR